MINSNKMNNIPNYFIARNVRSQMMASKDRIDAIKHTIATIYSAQRTLRALAPDFKWSGLGNVLGDFGEYIAISHYDLVKAHPGSDGFDATTKDGKTVQIKTNHSASTLGFRGKADKMLVIHVDDNGNWEELYYGDFDLVYKNSRLSKRDNKMMISVSKLKSIKE